MCLFFFWEPHRCTLAEPCTNYIIYKLFSVFCVSESWPPRVFACLFLRFPESRPKTGNAWTVQVQQLNFYLKPQLPLSFSICHSHKDTHTSPHTHRNTNYFTIIYNTKWLKGWSQWAWFYFEALRSLFVNKREASVKNENQPRWRGFM